MFFFCTPYFSDFGRFFSSFVGTLFCGSSVSQFPPCVCTKSQYPVFFRFRTFFFVGCVLGVIGFVGCFSWGHGFVCFFLGTPIFRFRTFSHIVCQFLLGQPHFSAPQLCQAVFFRVLDPKIVFSGLRSGQDLWKIGDIFDFGGRSGEDFSRRRSSPGEDLVHTPGFRPKVFLCSGQDFGARFRDKIGGRSGQDRGKISPGEDILPEKIWSTPLVVGRRCHFCFRDKIGGRSGEDRGKISGRRSSPGEDLVQTPGCRPKVTSGQDRGKIGTRSGEDFSRRRSSPGEDLVHTPGCRPKVTLFFFILGSR